MAYKIIEQTSTFDGPYCDHCQWGYSFMSAENKAAELIGKPCHICGRTLRHRKSVEKYEVRVPICTRCQSEDCEERYSLGITAGYWCDKDWATAPFRKEGREGYSYEDAGEYYEAEDY